MFQRRGGAVDLQTPFDVAVVMPTVLRPSLMRAASSVFAQDFAGRIQLLIGIDAAAGDPAILDRLAQDCPPQVALTLCDPGYSTSVRHGGLYPNRFSGALRTILSYAANSRYVAYLDDDNWWAPDHLATLAAAMADADWAWSSRWFVEASTDEPICIDDWESVGPDAGIFVEKFGGFVDPSSLMVDKFSAHDVLPFWSLSPFEDGSGEDRLIFAGLKGALRGRPTGKASSYYTINPHDPMQSTRLQIMRERGVILPSARRAGIRALGDVVPSAPDRRPGSVVPAPPAAFIVELLSRLKPREIVALDGAASAHGLAALARRYCAASVTVAPGAADSAIGLRPLPPTRDLAWLVAQPLAVDLVYLGRPDTPDDLAGRCRSVWAMVRPGGIVCAEGHVATDSGVADFIATTHARVLPAAVDGAHYWIVEKP
jgi:hypothetical protein